MRIKVGALRLIIRSLTEMKLGVAEPNPPGRYFGRKDEPEDSIAGSNLTRQSGLKFEPGAEYKAWNDQMPNHGNWDEDSDDDLATWLRGQDTEDTKVDDTQPQSSQKF